jgi:hypothetical protein
MGSVFAAGDRLVNEPQMTSDLAIDVLLMGGLAA